MSEHDRVKVSSDPTSSLLITEGWDDYALVDSGGGKKLERFGAYTFIRPEPQALWCSTLAENEWARADGVFTSGAGTEEEKTGRWYFKKELPSRWEMGWNNNEVKFFAAATPFRHLGVFPEHAPHWAWMKKIIIEAHRPVKILNLFGYTGIASLVCAAAGAEVTHVDASKKIIAWARENQKISGLEDRPIRWIEDDAMKFVQREVRRGAKYDGFIIDPPKFGRGPKGEVWNIHENLPRLLTACSALTSPTPLFTILTCYATRISSVSAHYALADMMAGNNGILESGEMALREQSARHLLSTAVFARWSTR
ncbi:MAG: class I SAM-dependent methyltransferase [bacterium]|nr:class I SAM-dependent methyltransferase [bacterium]MDZ4299825.1 class I SAM-dependent methyltransferase [Candidatus Sungbacteria bacterium]